MRNIVNHIRNVNTSPVWSACFAIHCLIFCYEDPCSSVVGSCVAGLCVYGVHEVALVQLYTLRLRVDGFMYCFILEHLLFNVLCCAVLCCVVLCHVVVVVLCCHVVFVVVVVVVLWCAVL